MGVAKVEIFGEKYTLRADAEADAYPERWPNMWMGSSRR